MGAGDIFLHAKLTPALCLPFKPQAPSSALSIPLPSPFLEPNGLRLEVQLWKRKFTWRKVVGLWETLSLSSEIN